MHLHRPHTLTPQVRRIDQDRVIADYACHDVGDRAEDGERVLSEHESCAVKRSQPGLGVRLKATYGLGLLSTTLWCGTWTSIARTSLSPILGCGLPRGRCPHNRAPYPSVSRSQTHRVPQRQSLAVQAHPNHWPRRCRPRRSPLVAVIAAIVASALIRVPVVEVAIAGPAVP
jgi:hypothetical protein